MRVAEGVQTDPGDVRRLRQLAEVPEHRLWMQRGPIPDLGMFGADRGSSGSSGIALGNAAEAVLRRVSRTGGAR